MRRKEYFKTVLGRGVFSKEFEEFMRKPNIVKQRANRLEKTRIKQEKRAKKLRPKPENLRKCYTC
jgi:hypothetical protein